MITSTQNTRVKLVAALQMQAKSRHKEGKIALEGARLVRDAIVNDHKADFILYTPDNENLIVDLQAGSADTLLVSDDVMRHISDTQQPPGIIGVFSMPAPDPPPLLQRVLILDAIRDPGNMGTILRTAAAAGIQVAILSPDCVDPYNPKALRGGMGAHFRVPVVEMTWEQIGVYCAPLWVYLADSHGDLRYNDVDWSAGWALIIGSEAHGAGEQAAKLASARIYIPIAAETESINAAMAAGMILFEAKRQS